MNLAHTLIKLISRLDTTQTTTLSKHTSNRAKESQAAYSDANLFPPRQQQGPRGVWNMEPGPQGPNFA